MIFVCEICSTPLGQVDLKNLSTPLLPEMFSSLDPVRELPVPFQPFQEFMTFRCRQCKARPFKEADHVTILDERGFKKRLNVNKLEIEQKTRVSNQARINEIFGEEYIEKPTPVSRFQDSIVSFFKGKRDSGFKCECGKEYKHQSSLIRHKAKCNG